MEAASLLSTAYLEELMHERALHGLVVAAAGKPLLQDCLALAAEAATDPGAREQQVRVQDHHPCISSGSMRPEGRSIST